MRTPLGRGLRTRRWAKGRRTLFTLVLASALLISWGPGAQAWLICNCVAQQAFRARGEEAERLIIAGGQKFFEARAHYATAIAQLEGGNPHQATTSLTQAIEALSYAIRSYRTVIQSGEAVGIRITYVEALRKVDYVQLGAQLQADPEIWQVITQLGREGNVLGLFREGLRRFEQNRALLEELYGIVASGLQPSMSTLSQVSNSLHETTLFGIYTSALAKKVSTACE